MRKLFRKDKTLSYINSRRINYTTFINSNEASNAVSLINSASNLFWDIETKSPALYITLDNNEHVVLTNLPDTVYNLIKGLLIPKEYILKKKETLIEVFSRSNHNSSFLFLETKHILLQKFFEETSNIKCLVSDRINLPIYFGHTSAIERLSEDSDYKYEILDLEEVLTNE